MKYCFILVRMAIIKEKTSAAKDMEEKKPFIYWWLGIAVMENTMELPPRN
jgi:hypothetical protein